MYINQIITLVKNAFAFAIIVGLIYSIMIFVKYKFNVNKTNFIIHLLFICYISALFQITVVRDWGDFFNFSNNIYSLSSVQLIPFKTTIDSLSLGIGSFTYHLFGNMIWFFPFGILFSKINTKHDKWLNVLKASFLCSFSIEVLQFVFGTGISDIDDIILNVFGATIAYLIFKKITLITC